MAVSDDTKDKGKFMVTRGADAPPKSKSRAVRPG